MEDLEGEEFIKAEAGTVQKCFENEVAVGVSRSAVDAHDCAPKLISALCFPVPGAGDACESSLCVEPGSCAH